MKKVSIVLVLILICCALCCCQPAEKQPSSDRLVDVSKKNIVIIIGDGMGVNHVNAGCLNNNGSAFDFTTWNKVLVDTNSLDGTTKLPTAMTDSAASATAMATGTLTCNGFVGKDSSGNNLSTVMDYAINCGKSTGIVTTDKLYGATPAGFSAHSVSRDDSATILQTQVQSNVNLLIGYPSTKYASSKSVIESHGYTYCDHYYELEQNMYAPKILAQLELEGYGNDSLSLSMLTSFALNYLSQDSDGFVLMVEQAHIDKYSHDNKFDNMVKSVASLNTTVETVKAYSKSHNNDTAIIVLADHETGGLLVSGRNIYQNTYVTQDLKRISYSFRSTGHTNQNIYAYTYGFNLNAQLLPFFGSNLIMKNSNLYDIVCALCNT